MIAVICASVGGLGVTLIASRSLIEEIFSMLRHKKSITYQRLALEITLLKDERDAAFTARDTLKSRLSAVRRENIADTHRLIRELRALEARCEPMLPRSIDAKERIERELGGDELPAFLRSQAGF